MRCMECDRPSLNLLEFLGENFLPLVYRGLYMVIEGYGGTMAC